jgi:hypothetical protein
MMNEGVKFMTTPKEWHRETLGKKVVEALKKNHFAAEYLPDKEAVRQRILELIPTGASVGIGGTVTIRDELNIVDDLKKRGHKLFIHNLPHLSPEENAALRRQQLTSDCFLASTNALTLDGQLVNVDGVGNRVAAMIYGPQKVIVVAGINKVVENVDSALKRIELWAAPMNNKRIGLPNPCTTTGVCMDCQGTTRICNVTTIIRKKPSQTDMTVLVVGEELGY